jgi:hypothetical protein
MRKANSDNKGSGTKVASKNAGSKPKNTGSTPKNTGSKPNGSGSGSGKRPNGSGKNPNGKGSGSGKRPNGEVVNPNGKGSGSGKRPNGEVVNPNGTGSGKRPNGSGKNPNGTGSGKRPNGSGSGKEKDPNKNTGVTDPKKGIYKGRKVEENPNQDPKLKEKRASIKAYLDQKAAKKNVQLKPGEKPYEVDMELSKKAHQEINDLRKKNGKKPL